MKSGAINLISESGQSIDQETFPKEHWKGDEKLLSTLRVERSQQLIDGTTITQGQTAYEETTNVKTHRIRPDGGLEVGRNEQEIEVVLTNFIYIEDEVLLTERTKADTACEMVETATDSIIEPSRIDIESFAGAHAEAELFLAWIRNEDEELTSVCGVGNITEDTEFERRLEQSESTQLSFDGLEWNGRQLRGTITRSGYVEIYQPHDVDTEEFARFIREEVVQYSSSTEEAS